jgi:hypothetical protein
MRIENKITTIDIRVRAVTMTYFKYEKLRLYDFNLKMIINGLNRNQREMRSDETDKKA